MDSNPPAYTNIPLTTMSSSSSPDSILNSCRAIDTALGQIDHDLETLAATQQHYLSSTDTSPSWPFARETDRLTNKIASSFRALVDQTRLIKSDPLSSLPRNAAQVGRMDRKLRATMSRSQQLESSYRAKVQEQTKREYRIVRPELSEREIDEAVEGMGSSGEQIFSQALFQGVRASSAQQTVLNVRSRHAEVRKIEAQMAELAQLFLDLEAVVLTQELPVAQIEEQSGEVVVNTDKGLEEMENAVGSAKGVQKRKWMCFWISVLIVLILVGLLVVVLYAAKIVK